MQKVRVYWNLQMQKILNKNVPSIETRSLTKNDLKVMLELVEFKEFLEEEKEIKKEKK